MKKRSLPLINQLSGRTVWSSINGSSWYLDINGLAYNTPTLGSELVTNGSMETGTPPTNWTSAGAGFSIASVLDERTGGIGTDSLAATYSANAQRVYQGITLATDQWLQVTFWAKKTSGPLDTFIFQVRETNISGILTVEVGDVAITSTWQQYTMSARSLTTNPVIVFRSPNGLVSPQIVDIDDVSAKVSTLSSLFAVLETNRSDVTIKASMVIDGTNTSSRTIGGVVTNVDNESTPLNFIQAYHDTVVFRALKCVNGVYTVLVSIATTYRDYGSIEIRRISTETYRFLYDGIQIGDDQIINDATVIDNTLHGLFSTSPFNKFSRLVIDGSIVPFGF
jgi:hypothetical protein